LIEFPRLQGVCSFDCETKDPEIEEMGPGWAFPDRGPEVIGFSISWDEGKQAHYWPIAHASGNYPREKCLAFLRDVMADTSITWVFYNRLHDEGWLRRLGIPVKGKKLDAYTAVPLLDEYRYSYALDDVAQDYIGEGKQDVKKLQDLAKQMKLRGSWKNHIWRFPADTIRPYATQDARMTLKLWIKVWEMIQAESLVPIFELETKLLTVLLEMRWRGIPVDLDKAAQAADKYRREEKRIQGQIKKLAGVGVDIWAAESIQKAYDKMGLSYPLTPKTKKPSFRKTWLNEHPHPLSRLIAQERKLAQTRNTFLEGYILKKHYKGRIACCRKMESCGPRVTTRNRNQG
jgi:DNA polymerase I-like protein with 3'-5' exonuclease and polymerase domains